MHNNVADVYLLFTETGCQYFCDWIEFLVQEKRVVKWTDDATKLEHFAKPQFQAKMNEYVKDYQKQKKAKASTLYSY